MHQLVHGRLDSVPYFLLAPHAAIARIAENVPMTTLAMSSVDPGSPPIPKMPKAARIVEANTHPLRNMPAMPTHIRIRAV